MADNVIFNMPGLCRYNMPIAGRLRFLIGPQRACFELLSKNSKESKIQVSLFMLHEVRQRIKVVVDDDGASSGTFFVDQRHTVPIAVVQVDSGSQVDFKWLIWIEPRHNVENLDSFSSS